MAKFINRQEEVLQIQLTPYGKHQFSRGEFNPEYYAYYDDDILEHMRDLKKLKIILLIGLRPQIV